MKGCHCFAIRNLNINKMNFQKFSRQEVVDFLKQHIHTDLPEFLLKRSPFTDISIQELAQQLKGRKIAEKKFSFLLNDNIVFPPHLNLEQSSSESTSRYKAENLNGKTFLDLTAGFGIDAYFLSQNFQEITLLEKNEDLLNTVEHNWKILDKKAEFILGDLEEFIAKTEKKFDVIYLDPARRSLEKRKVFLLEDLSPNILEIQDRSLELGRVVITKLSPMIDITYLVSVLKDIFKIEIIAVKNDVKEVVVYQNKDLKENNIEIICVDLETEEETFKYNFGEEKGAIAKFSNFQKYLYIPNNPILKSGAFNLISDKFKVFKLHQNTQFYTKENLIKEFPGRILEMKIINSKEIQKGEKWNIISKNYPLSVAEIEKKYKIKSGGNRYLIFTQTVSGKIILESL